MMRELSAGVDESAIMPAIAGLPEPMEQAEFKRRYRAVGSEPYLQVSKEIDRRLASCSLYQGR